MSSKAVYLCDEAAPLVGCSVMSQEGGLAGVRPPCRKYAGTGRTKDTTCKDVPPSLETIDVVSPVFPTTVILLAEKGFHGLVYLASGRSALVLLCCTV